MGDAGNRAAAALTAAASEGGQAGAASALDAWAPVVQQLAEGAAAALSPALCSGRNVMHPRHYIKVSARGQQVIASVGGRFGTASSRCIFK